LQDHFRQYVKPAFTDVYRDRGEAVGVAEFETMDDMLYAIKKLDDTEFKNPFEKSYIRLVEVSTARAGCASSAGLMHKACSA
jgi:arginine/serine-rich splicing factor 1/9